MPHPTCDGCGKSVSPRFARTLGNNEHTVARCITCSEGENVLRYAAE